jgi:mRNA interferase MazF
MVMRGVEVPRIEMHRGDVYWCDFGITEGQGPAKRRPVVVVSGPSFVASDLPTVVVVACTTNLAAARYPGSVFIPVGTAGLPRDCAVRTTEIATVDRYLLLDRLGTMPSDLLADIDRALALSLSR